MLNHLKSEANIAYTENGAVTNASTMSDCLDLFAAIGALRAADDQEIIRRFVRAYAEDADIAMKILFFGRDVRGGLGERRVFRVIINWLAENRAESLRKNIELIPEFGRYDDLVSLIGTACEKDALRTIRKQLEADLASDAEVSLLAKWLPSVNASNAETVRKAKRIARYADLPVCIPGKRRLFPVVQHQNQEGRLRPRKADRKRLENPCFRRWPDASVYGYYCTSDFCKRSRLDYS